MKTEHRGLVAIVLSAAIFILWYTVIAPPPKETVETKPVAQGAVEESETPKETQEPKATRKTAEEVVVKSKDDPQAGLPLKTTILKTDFLTAEFSTAGGVPEKWVLKNYITEKKKDDEGKKEAVDVDLVSHAPGEPPAMNLVFMDTNFVIPQEPRYALAAHTDNSLIYRWESKEVRVDKKINISPDNYLADVTIEITNKTNRVLTERPMLSWSGVSIPQKSSGFFGFLKQPPANNKSPVYYLNGKVEREKNVNKMPTEEMFSGALYWAGLEDRYFLTAIIPRDQSSQTTAEIGAKDIRGDKGGRIVYAGAALAKTSISPGEKVIHKYSVYAGPKEINQLKAVGVRLEESIDYGWFTVIAIPILYALKFFHKIVRNYGVAIILLTIFIKLLLHPINKKSMKSMKAMQKLQPKLKELQKKFKGDRNRLNAETMQLFKAHKVNPMGGCLPMLLQFPIYIALYKVLWSSIELYHAPFFWFYKDLSAPDPYLITPILLGIGMMLQQKIMPSASADPTQKKMMMMMPIMFSVFMLFLPVGLVIYILINTVMSVTQQWMYNHDIKFRDLIRGRFKTVKVTGK